jgi:hypothetical protein
MPTYFETNLEFAFQMEEGSGSSRVSAYGSDVATEQGGAVQRVTGGQSGYAASTLRADGTQLVVADRAGNRIGNFDWTLKVWIKNHYADGAWLGYLSKGAGLDHSYEAGNLVTTVDGEVFSFSFGFGGTDGAAYYLILRYTAATQKLRCYIPSIGDSEVTHVWTGGTNTSDWLFGAAAAGQGNNDIDEACLWSKALTDARITQLVGGKLISDFPNDPTDITGNRTWIQAEVGQAGSHQLTNSGGAVDAGGWTKIAGTWPTGHSIDADTGLVSWDGTAAVTADTTVTIQAANGTGTSTVDIHFVIDDLFGTGHFSNVSPRTRIAATRGIGVVADKANDPVTQVTFKVDGGIGTTVTSRAINPDTGLSEWWFTFNPASYSDGVHTIQATIQHAHGKDLVVTMDVMTDHGGTIGTSRDRYVDPVGGSNSNAGTIGSPMKDAWKAALDVQSAHGDCGGATIYCKGDNRFDRHGLGGSIAATQGAIRFKAWPGEAAHSCRFTSSDITDHVRTTSTTYFEVEDMDVLCDLDAEAGDNNGHAWYGNTRFPGPGRTTGTLQGLSASTWPAGRWACGRVCTPGTEADNWVVWKDNPRGPLFSYATNIKQQNTGNQAFGGQTLLIMGAEVDNVDATGTDDGTGHEFHNDGIQLGFDGGRIGCHYGQIKFTKTRVSLFFHRSGVNETVPTRDIVLEDIRYDDDTFEGGKYLWISRPVMGLKMSNITAPRSNLKLQENPSDFGGRPVRQSHIEIKGTFFYDHALTSVGFSGRNDACDHLTIDYNATTGSADSRGTHAVSTSAAAALNLATTYDFTVLASGTIDKVMPRVANVLFDVDGLARDATTSVGAYRGPTETGGAAAAGATASSMLLMGVGC